LEFADLHSQAEATGATSAEPTILQLLRKRGADELIYAGMALGHPTGRIRSTS
jgi:hypothetical protein